MFEYRIDVIELLRANNINSYVVRKNKLFSESTMQKFRTGQMVSLTEIDKLCRLTHVQPWDVLAFSFDDEEDI